jgi:hypothetical protein
MSEEPKQTVTIRIPKVVADRVEDAARNASTSPTALLQAIVIRKFRSAENADREIEASQTAIAPKLESIRKALSELERKENLRFERLRFEMVKTRSALLHSLDETLGADAVDRVIEASDQTAREYIASLDPVPENDHESQS